MIDLVMGGKLLKEAAKYQHGPQRSTVVIVCECWVTMQDFSF